MIGNMIANIVPSIKVVIYLFILFIPLSLIVSFFTLANSQSTCRQGENATLERLTGIESFLAWLFYPKNNLKSTVWYA